MSDSRGTRQSTPTQTPIHLQNAATGLSGHRTAVSRRGGHRQFRKDVEMAPPGHGYRSLLSLKTFNRLKAFKPKPPDQLGGSRHWGQSEEA